jgi:hypothetical protein
LTADLRALTDGEACPFERIIASEYRSNRSLKIAQEGRNKIRRLQCGLIVISLMSNLPARRLNCGRPAFSQAIRQLQPVDIME